MNALIFAIGQLMHTVINIYIWVIIIAAFLSFVRPDPYNPIVQTLSRLTEPVFAWVRRKLPFVVLSGIDLSPIVIILGLQFVDTFMLKLIWGWVYMLKKALLILIITIATITSTEARIVTLNDLAHMPRSIEKDYYIWRFLTQKSTSRSQAKQIIKDASQLNKNYALHTKRRLE